MARKLTKDFSWKNATFMAKIAHAAYMGPDEFNKTFYKQWKDGIDFFSKGGTECYVLHCDKNYIVAFRGTEPSKLNDVMADLHIIKNTAMAGGRVHGGFQKEVNDLWMDILAELEHNDQLKVRKDVYMTGHSLGAAMATIASTRYQPTELFTFGSPRVGGPRFVKNIKCIHYRFMNNNDIVCRIPPAWLGFRHHGEMIYFNRFGDKALKPTWGDMFYGIWNSWKRFKFFDGIVDHGMPNYVKAISKLKKAV